MNDRMGLYITFGVVFGIMTGHLAIGVALGVVFGAMRRVARERRALRAKP